MRRTRAIVALLVLACGPVSPGETAAATTTEDASASATASSATAMMDLPFEPPPVACADRPTTGAEPGDPPTLCPERPQTDACCCFDAIGKQNNSSEGTVSVCGVHELCPVMQFECIDFLIDEVHDCPSVKLATDDVAAVDCSLKALADGATGRIAWRAVAAFGFSHEDTQLDLAGDGTVFRSGDRHIDYYYEIAAVVRLPLPDASYFAACAKAPDWRDRFECLRAALSCPPLATCVEGYLLDTTQGAALR